MTSAATAPRARGTAIALGVLIALAGVVLLIWPGVTTLVLVSALGVAIVVYGIHELIDAFSDSGVSGGSRVWSIVVGIVALIGGIAIFLTPLVSAITVGLVIGAYWVVGGIIGIIGAIVESGNRFIRALVAALSIMVGLAVLVQPGLSLVVLVWFAGAWMVIAGLVMIVGAMFGRRRALAAS
ncbi:MAG TPA: DUF308 domain-containing protein [Euzebyales bacterium]|nr:DUF308 domain-containing protein [Euzebyales bacterium]